MHEHTVAGLLPSELLDEIRSRAAAYDRENRFFTEDLQRLRDAGYLAGPVPQSLGGAGLTLLDATRAQRRLASAAPATALGVNMHLVWVAVARFLHGRAGGGRGRLDWVLEDAVAGELFAFGISEAGNEAVLLDAFSSAEPHPEGGYRVRGTKIFTTLSPVWTRLGVHARYGEGDAARIVFGFVRRSESGLRDQSEGSVGLSAGSIEHPGVWNPLGMRATQSWTTSLEGVRIREEDVAAVTEPSDGSDPLILGIFSSFSLLTASVYAGIADRALDLAREAANQLWTRPDGTEGIRMDDPDTAARLTAAVLDHRAAVDAIETLAQDIDAQRDRDDWFLALAAAKNRATDEARSAVDLAMRLVGARGYQADSELARLYRDVVAGMFHPSSSRALAATVRASLTEQD